MTRRVMRRSPQPRSAWTNSNNCGGRPRRPWDMPIQNDFREFLRLLKVRHVDFVILGGYAVAFHGYVRNTQDLDILFRADDRGVRGVMAALQDFGFPAGTVTPEEVARPGNIIRMGIPPVRIELLNSVSGVTFDEVWAGRVAADY